jgi:predicted DNA-binding transcriptional regulator AlpA
MPPRDKAVNAELVNHARRVKTSQRDLPRVWPVDRPYDPKPGDRHLTKPEVVEFVRVSYQKIWEWMIENQFPRPFVIGERNVWLLSELHEFIRSLPRRRLKNDPPLPAPASDPPPRQRRAPPARASTRRIRSSERAPMTE